MRAQRVALAVIVLGACQTLPARQDVPAVLTNPSVECRAELARVVRLALGGAPLTLADDALTREATLIVERARPRDADGRPLSGRDPGRPQHFRLVKNGDRCQLLHEESGRRWTLSSATCSPP